MMLKQFSPPGLCGRHRTPVPFAYQPQQHAIQVRLHQSGAILDAETCQRRQSGHHAPTQRRGHLVLSRVSKPSGATAQLTTEHWWKKDAELWTDIHDVDSFKREVVKSDKPVIVEWFASWCTGCQKSYPEICKVIKMNPQLQSEFKFVKVCVDDMKAFSREQGVTALPRMSLYRPGAGRVLTWDIPYSRVKHLKKNLEAIVANPHSSLALDPNNFIIPTGPLQSTDDIAKAEAKKAQEIAALNKGSQSLFERLRAVANGATKPAANGAPAAAAAAAPPPPPPAPSPPTPIRAAALMSEHDLATLAEPATPPPAPEPAAVAEARRLSAQQLAAELESRYKAMYGHAMSLEKQMFINRSNGDYGYNGQIDTLYPAEIGVRLPPLPPDSKPQHYLDYTGSGLYCNTQLESVFKELSSHVFGNPHSPNPSSALSSERIEEVRDMILQFFNADPAEWQVVFTRSATGALKLVGETFPWSPGSLFRYLRENHNSVLGIREYALRHDGQFQAVDENLVSDWLRAPHPDWNSPVSSVDELPSQHDHAPGDCTGTNAKGGCEVDWEDPEDDVPSLDEVTYSLFAYPAEDNFAGVKYPLSWAAEVKARSTATHKWMVMIDAAAYVPTQHLDLSQVQADFVDIAFYKMFGYPTGLGALLIRTEAVPILNKVFWGGGSVALATSKENFHVLKCRPSEMLEDGTVSFLDILSLKYGFQMFDKLGGIDKVQAHVACLTEWLYDALTKVRHTNGRPLVRVFGKHGSAHHREVQGGIVNFQLRSPRGLPISYKRFEKEAAAAGFHVRTGAECNPGACYAYLGIADEEVESLAGEKEGCDDDVEFVSVMRPANSARHTSLTLKSLDMAERLELGLPQPDPSSKWVQAPLGSIRASLGWMSTFEDVYAFADFVAKYKDLEEYE